MTLTGLEELEEMAVRLEATARELPEAPERDELLRDIANFRAQLIARLRQQKYLLGQAGTI